MSRRLVSRHGEGGATGESWWSRNRAIAVMHRRSPHWITNRARSRRCHAVDLDRPFCELAEHAARAVGIDYAAWISCRTAKGLLVTEVNNHPFYRGFLVHHFTISVQ